AALERIDIERLLATLPVGYRTVVILHDIEGFTHDEISAALGISQGTAKSQLARGRRALRDAVAPDLATGRSAS
ncbi:MAG: RNA polymerase sigma factor, partial [Steroidobacteraceae bacterium]